MLLIIDSMFLHLDVNLLSNSLITAYHVFDIKMDYFTYASSHNIYDYV